MADHVDSAGVGKLQEVLSQVQAALSDSSLLTRGQEDLRERWECANVGNVKNIYER